MRTILFAVSFLTLLANAATSEDSSPLKTLMTGNDSRGWEAVGRLDIGGRAFCTGALIAPDLVLTAAHCLFDKKGGRKFNDREIEFLAGWRNGRANAYRSVRRAIPHPNFQYSGDNRITRVAYDIAILQLDRPIQKSSVRHFATSIRPRKGAEVGVVSYAHDRAESPSLQEVCHVLARQSGTLVLSCDVDFGSSGAPVFTIGDDGVPEIVSVISAKADVRGRSVALGTSLEKPLADLLKIVASDEDVQSNPKPKTRVLTLGSSNDGTGAKFLRP